MSTQRALSTTAFLTLLAIASMMGPTTLQRDWPLTTAPTSAPRWSFAAA